ncbi:MAG: cbb3-type cytochrome c oxidase subunit I [Candidatus Binatus sp.]|uniref:cbb3-type cytochrome c oxidase subunit I n=1 Tax=Candidatus Binatus sp. TaxID=2811406 RepID=UPI003C735A4D
MAKTKPKAAPSTDAHERMGFWRQYIFSIDHKVIGKQYLFLGLFMGYVGVFLIPLMVGARDMAFPRLNMASFWTIFVGSMLLLVSFFVPGGGSHAGWTNYVPLSDAAKYLPGNYWGGNLWLIALAIDFASVLMGGINFLTTAIAMRAPGMTFWRMPLLVWQELAARTYLTHRRGLSGF